jgi:hypothetical protein
MVLTVETAQPSGFIASVSSPLVYFHPAVDDQSAGHRRHSGIEQQVKRLLFGQSSVEPVLQSGFVT